MNLQVLASIIAAGTVPSLWANDGDDAKTDPARQTRVGVAALANSPKVDARRDAKPAVRVLANVRKQRNEPDYDNDESNQIDRSSIAGPMNARPDALRQGGRRQNEGAGREQNHGRQFGAVGPPMSVHQWGGFVPPNQWGFMNNNGANFNQIGGYRRFGFPSAFAGGGFGFGYGNPYLVPSYYGYGFSPVVFGLSGPVVVRYEDPMGRQWKQMYDGILKGAEKK